MRKLKISLLVWMLLWGFTTGLHSQNASKVSLVNTGQMHVRSSGAANIYVLGGVRMKNGTVPVNIVQQGVTKLTGNFYQDCTGHVFATDAAGIGTSAGTVCFFDPVGGSDLIEKHITTTSLPTFSRSGNYVAFPSVQIDMDKNLILPSRMAADMTKLVVGTGKNGKLWLKSLNDGSANPGRIYDASLRFPKRPGDAESVTTQSANAPAGKIIVERDIKGYRENTSGKGIMFPFATPFYGTQRSGYFAGNWVRRPVADASHHTEYTYGDMPDPATGKIAREQNITDPLETLKAGQAYLIKPLGMDEFDDLVANYPEYALQITGAGAPIVEDYRKTMFVFDGSVYQLDDTEEQLNLMPVFDAAVTGKAGQYTRILIGNSYTSALDLKKISEYMINHSLVFSRYIGIFYPHLRTYVGYDVVQHIWGQETPAALTTEHTIPGMGVFMLVLDNVASSGTIKIDRSFLTHGNSAHNLRSTNGFRDEVLFTLESESFPEMKDLAAIGFRNGAKEEYDDLDMSKAKPAYKEASTIQYTPLLYTLSSDGKELASNSIPEGTSSVNLCIESTYTKADRCTLYVSRQESLNTECLLLEDKAAKIFVDLKEYEYYDFTLYPGDGKDRFAVHFSLPTNTGDINSQPLKMFHNKQFQTLDITGLTEKDNSSALVITDTQGRILIKESLKDSHDVSYLIEGVYIAKIIGERSVVLKFSKNK